jgi:inorganic triphosphatase YgiF
VRKPTPRTQQELELKLVASDAGAARAAVRALGVPASARGRTEDVEDLYLDTEDRALLRSGWAFRLRRRGKGPGEATLKATGGAAGDGVHDREERTAPWTHASTDPRLLPEGEPRATVLSLARGRPLEPLATVRAKRTTWRVEPERGLGVVVSLDRVRLACRGAKASRTEVEAERQDGDPDAFKRWAASVRAPRGARRSEESKLEAALGVARVPLPTADEVAAARLASAPAPKPSTPAAAAGARSLARLSADLSAALAAARRGSVEGVHDVRTVARRTRAALAAWREEVPGATRRELGARLRALRHVADSVRELDVLAEFARDAAAKSGAPADAAALSAVLAARRREARKTLSTALAARRFATLPAALVHAAAATTKRPSPALAVAGAARLPAAVEESIGLAARLSGRFQDASAPSLHALRLALKRARYAAEAFSDAFGKPVARFVDAVRDLQDALGAVQDARRGREGLRKAVSGRGADPARRAAATRAAAATVDALEREEEKARRRMGRLVEKALGERPVRDLWAHVGKRAAGASGIS